MGRGFNYRQALTEERFRTRMLPRLSALRFLPYQIRQLTAELLPALRRHEDRKTLLRVVGELARVSARWRCLPFHYFRYGLYRSGISGQEVAAYLPESVLFHRLLPQVNRDTAQLDDKVVSKRILASAGVPQPALLAHGDVADAVLLTGRRVPLGEVARHVGGCSRVVVKPARYSSGGDGVEAVSPRELDLLAYSRQWGSWLMEEYAEQHADTATLNPLLLNTFRVITCLYKGDARVAYVMLKLGPVNGISDNSGAGGMQIRVYGDGVLDEYGYDRHLHSYTHHAASGAVFSGHKISMIKEIRELAHRCALLFPQTPFIGWDIAVTPDGPVVIEGNSSPSLAHIQRTHGGVAPELLPLLLSIARRPLV